MFLAIWEGRVHHHDAEAGGFYPHFEKKKAICEGRVFPLYKDLPTTANHAYMITHKERLKNALNNP
jgi:hypothetical protein